MEDHPQPCALCLFCEEVGKDHIRCTNPDVAQDSGWDAAYMAQGYLDLPLFTPEQEPCFWYVRRR